MSPRLSQQKNGCLACNMVLKENSYVGKGWKTLGKNKSRFSVLLFIETLANNRNSIGFSSFWFGDFKIFLDFFFNWFLVKRILAIGTNVYFNQIF